ncbi:aldehyde dehydrogenase family protein [Arthrobacter cupressi]|uniref:Aldehyde dehydrogenase (NAD+) n=1 Tax=Arthrobacter cupressi TaxID=1045773 RepID=A0A1G8VWC4_9MICC|nr:aldehyde dehydrogenase family protein [Arthrobacter cupressi]NYD78591.1 aldehyde dehydrogenase (NAD+) [Arthrobacter cupressi]SDJ70364.1 aldehyde dehydrogenase (NAD+) [Arthrobacter cupressi]
MSVTELHQNYIDGQWRPSSAGKTFANTNPANTKDVLGHFPDSTAQDALDAVGAAAKAGKGWEALGSIKRGDILFAAAEILSRRKEELAAAVTREQGKCLRESRGEAQRAIDILRYIAGEGRRLSGSTLPADEPRTLAMTWRKPIGVVALITPWNFPLAIPVWKMAPALLSGCTAIIKPSPLAPLTSALLVDIFNEAGVPAGVLNLVQGDREPGEALCEHPDVRGISFTGSLPVGLSIQKAAAPRLARTQLELGGKNAVIVLADADLTLAANAILLGAFGQAGQRCSATSRVVVDRRVREELVAKVLGRMEELRIGDPTDEATKLGPVVNQERLDACLAAIEQARADGATVRTGGSRATAGVLADGYFMEPTLITDVAPDSGLATEEVFGPVLSVIDAENFGHAMEISNSVKYGMSGTIFTNNRAHAYDALQSFEAGMLHVNRPGVGAWPHLPHMGAKLSQYGAPECSPETWEFYMEWRSACISFPA